MRLPQFLLFCLGLGLLTACQRPDSKTSLPTEILADTTSEQPQHSLADTVAHVAALMRERDSLIQRFAFNANDLHIGSYHHKTWWSSYYIRRDVLHAGVDRDGVVFLMDTYNCTSSGPRMCHARFAELEIELGDSSFLLRSNKAIEDSIWGDETGLQPPLAISTGRQCNEVFLLIGQPQLAQMLADTAAIDLHYARSCDGRRVGPRVHEGKRDLAALRDCVRLGRVLSELRDWGANQLIE